MTKYLYREKSSSQIYEDSNKKSLQYNDLFINQGRGLPQNLRSTDRWGMGPPVVLNDFGYLNLPPGFRGFSNI